jgi:hypothetical protein
MSVHGVGHSHKSCGDNQANQTSSSNGTNSSGGTDHSKWQEIVAALLAQAQNGTQNSSASPSA